VVKAVGRAFCVFQSQAAHLRPGHSQETQRLAKSGNTRMMEKSESLPLFLTAAGINERVRPCHSVTLRRALKAGKIRGKLHGKRIYYETQSVIDWMKGVEPSAPRRSDFTSRRAPRRRGRPRKVKQGQK
jgi:hypothetical protein